MGCHAAGWQAHAPCMGAGAHTCTSRFVTQCRPRPPRSRIMLHQPSGGAQGQASDIAIAAQVRMELIVATLQRQDGAAGRAWLVPHCSGLVPRALWSS